MIGLICLEWKLSVCFYYCVLSFLLSYVIFFKSLFETKLNVSLGTLPSERFNDRTTTDEFRENSFSMVSSEFTGENIISN